MCVSECLVSRVSQFSFNQLCVIAAGMSSYDVIVQVSALVHLYPSLYSKLTSVKNSTAIRQLPFVSLSILAHSSSTCDFVILKSNTLGLRLKVTVHQLVADDDKVKLNVHLVNIGSVFLS